MKFEQHWVAGIRPFTIGFFTFLLADYLFSKRAENIVGEGCQNFSFKFAAILSRVFSG